MASEHKKAITALEEYGYALFPDGKYRRMGKMTQVWEPVEGGFLRYDMENGAEAPQIHSVSEKGQGLAGLDKATHSADMFNWVYSDEEVERIYRGALESQGA